ncbi:MAG: gluconate 2-dehydrogenase subunit 3 family protein [Gammaproteobacteria bacterium]|nr:gluconate 2-dehydrogenase subunit 3 family protein [Gammaproteobacteria bacterium]
MNNKNKTHEKGDGNTEQASLSRRNLLKGVGLTGAALMTAGSASVMAQTPAIPARIRVTEALETLTAAESAALDAMCSRILPSDDGTPGAHEARAVHYIDRGLTSAMAASREQYAVGLAALDTYAMQVGGKEFCLLTADQQDSIIDAMTRNAIPEFPMLGTAFFNTVRTHTIDGTFSDPYYGGNRDFVGWDLIGYPGVRAVSSPGEISQGRALAPSRQSAYDMPPYTKDPVGPASAQTGGASHGH